MKKDEGSANNGSEAKKQKPTAKSKPIPRKPAGQLSRATEVRYYRILEILQAHEYANATIFEEQVGVSSRQLTRDMAYLQHSHKYPIEYCSSKKGWHFTEPVTHFASMLISAREIVALLLARRAMERTRNAAFAQHLDQAIEKFGVTMTDEIKAFWNEIDSIISFRSSSAEVLIDVDVFMKVCDALLAQEELQLMYRKLDAGPRHEPKRLRPYHLLCVDNVWYLIAHEPGNSDPKPHRYVLSRMSIVVRTGQKFERPTDFNLDEYLIHSVGVYGGDDPQPIHLRLGKRAALWFGERRFHDTQEFIPHEDGTAELKMNVAINPELERLILGWGSQVEVLGPASLRKSIWESARVVLERGPDLPG